MIRAGWTANLLGRGLLLGALALTVGCTQMQGMRDRIAPAASDTNNKSTLLGSSLRFEERDVEAPDVFAITDKAVWDGRPSFGGVWVAVPGQVQPERVRIVNLDTGKAVVGALFKRESTQKGPRVELSSDAAAALGAIPGRAQNVKIVALRRETVELPVEQAASAAKPQGEIMTTTLPDLTDSDGPSAEAVAGAATAALVASSAQTSDTPEARPKAPAKKESSSAKISKPYIQVGTFSSAENAADLVKILNKNDVKATVRTSKTSAGKSLHRVLAGPATSASDRTEIADRVKTLGFSDAFPVQG